MSFRILFYKQNLKIGHKTTIIDNSLSQFEGPRAQHHWSNHHVSSRKLKLLPTHRSPSKKSWGGRITFSQSSLEHQAKMQTQNCIRKYLVWSKKTSHNFQNSWFPSARRPNNSNSFSMPNLHTATKSSTTTRWK